MGQKANPNGMRVGVIRDWKAHWYSADNKLVAKWTIQDRLVRKYLMQFVKEWLIGDVIIERTPTTFHLKVISANPGKITGQDGKNIKKHEIQIKRIIKDKNIKVIFDVINAENPELSATIVANEIAISLENRGSFRLAQKKAIAKVMKAGAKGIKTEISGRLNGVDMARTEGYSEGVVPLQTLRNNIDFAIAEALTTYGKLGIKVWISRGEVLKGKDAALEAQKEVFVSERKPFDRNRKPWDKNRDAKGGAGANGERKPFNKDGNKDRQPFSRDFRKARPDGAKKPEGQATNIKAVLAKRAKIAKPTDEAGDK